MVKSHRFSHRFSRPVFIIAFIAIKIYTQIGENVRSGENREVGISPILNDIIIYTSVFGENVRLFPLFLSRKKKVYIKEFRAFFTENLTETRFN